MSIKYRVVWHNNSACDSLGDYNSKADAIAAGEEWFHSMVAVDDNPKEAAEVYAYEVEEIEEETPNEEQEEYQTPQQMGWVGQDGLP